MFTKTSEFYDLIYFQFKDYEKESDQLHWVIQNKNPGAKTILDAACGTAEHARILSEKYGYEITGVDLNPDFIEIARQKIPGRDFHVASIDDFKLDGCFDVVMCLFSSIGYLKTMESLTSAVDCFKRHLGENGFMIIEPWLTPENFETGHISLHTAETESIKVARMVRGEKIANMSRLVFEYLIGNSDGITRESEVHELTLFTKDEMERVFLDCGLTTEYDPEGIFGRGLYQAKVSEAG